MSLCFIYGSSLLTNWNFSGFPVEHGNIHRMYLYGKNGGAHGRTRKMAAPMVEHGNISRMYVHGKKMAMAMVEHGNFPRMYLHGKKMAAPMVITPLNTQTPIIL